MATDSSNPTTVYIRNLNERAAIPDLKATLKFIFGDYGKILDIIAMTSLRRKGQAFVVFDNHDSARRSIEELNGFDIFNKPMDLQYAKARSDALVKAEKGEEGLEQWKRQRKAEKERKAAVESTQVAKLKRPAPSGPPGAQEPLRKLAKLPGATGVLSTTGAPTAGAGLKPSTTSGAAGGIVPDEYLPPNKILFVQNIPDDIDKVELAKLFSVYEGFREVRPVPGRRNIAFVEYADLEKATIAKNTLSGMQIGAERRLLKVSELLYASLDAYVELFSGGAEGPVEGMRALMGALEINNTMAPTQTTAPPLPTPDDMLTELDLFLQGMATPMLMDASNDADPPVERAASPMDVSNDY